MTVYTRLATVRYQEKVPLAQAASFYELRGLRLSSLERPSYPLLGSRTNGQ